MFRIAIFTVQGRVLVGQQQVVGHLIFLICLLFYEQPNPIYDQSEQPDDKDAYQECYNT